MFGRSLRWARTISSQNGVGSDEFIGGDSNRQTVTSISNLRETHARDSSELPRVEEKEHACDLLGRFGLDVRVEERSKMSHAPPSRVMIGLPRLGYAVRELDRSDVTVLDAPAHECTGEQISRGGPPVSQSSTSACTHSDGVCPRSRR